ncbi:MAG: DNA cytosine methyltransferase [Lachnospiraceae bacterium]|nr:DNA cytosine methyltransferase [Lachnospiraceae bacterium]
MIKGPKRNVAWRVLDAKYFGLPQQRRRLYVLAGGKDFSPENILFEGHVGDLAEYPEYGLTFNKEGHTFEIFRAYSDCLYSAYGTKWNGNAAANNGSLFVTQDGRIRRLSPLECERLMGFPDNYTDIKGAKKTNRYQAIGNSWAVPVVEWIGRRLMNANNLSNLFSTPLVNQMIVSVHGEEAQGTVYDFNGEMIQLNNGTIVNTSYIPEESVFRSLEDIVTAQDVPDSIYISPVGCKGILRRSQERKTNINMRLRLVLERISREMDDEEIERRSRVQKRGRLSVNLDEEPIAVGQ